MVNQKEVACKQNAQYVTTVLQSVWLKKVHCEESRMAGCEPLGKRQFSHGFVHPQDTGDSGRWSYSAAVGTMDLGREGWRGKEGEGGGGRRGRGKKGEEGWEEE